jgi:Tfp pilus assembly protein PilX
MVVIMGIMGVIFTLALVALYLMTQQSRIAEHKVRRMRGFFAAQAGTVHALEQLRNGVDPNGTSVNIGATLVGYPTAGLSVGIAVGAVGVGGAPAGTRAVSATVDYGT